MKKAQFGTGIVRKIARTKISDVPAKAKSAVKSVAKKAVNTVKNATVGDVTGVTAARKVANKAGKAIKSLDSAAYKNGGKMGKCKGGC